MFGIPNLPHRVQPLCLSFHGQTGRHLNSRIYKPASRAMQCLFKGDCVHRVCL